MFFYTTNNWILFFITFGLMLLLSSIMSIQSRNFYTKDVVVRKFSMMDLALAATPVELVNIIKGLYELPAIESKKAVNALKAQLYTDFLFMPCTYITVFILSMSVANKMQLHLGQNFFIGLAWLQLIPWLCDITENIYLLSKIRPNVVKSDPSAHKAFLLMEAVKWFIALTGAVCSVSAICYFWLAGRYSSASLKYILIVLAEIILFVIAQTFFSKKKVLAENEGSS